jgi:hypothetical protein
VAIAFVCRHRAVTSAIVGRGPPAAPQIVVWNS